MDDHQTDIGAAAHFEAALRARGMQLPRPVTPPLLLECPSLKPELPVPGPHVRVAAERTAAEFERDGLACTHMEVAGRQVLTALRRVPDSVFLSGAIGAQPMRSHRAAAPDASPWQTTIDDGQRLTARARVPATPTFPFDHVVTRTAWVAPGALHLVTQFFAPRPPVPAVFGYAAYVPLPAPPENCRFMLPRGWEVPLDARGVATGGRIPVKRRSLPLTATAGGCYEVPRGGSCAITGAGRAVKLVVPFGLPYLALTPLLTVGTVVLAAMTAPPGALVAGSHGNASDLHSAGLEIRAIGDWS